MVAAIKSNLVFLNKNLRSLPEVLAYLIQNDIISENERQVIEAKPTCFEKNDELLKMIQTRNWDSIRGIFLEILRKTNNKFCADQIEGLSLSSPSNRNLIRHPKISKQNCWWPEKKRLIKSIHRRKYGNGDRSLVEELHNQISKTEEERQIVICESVVASKYSGMGGMGKTLTAKWYANEYENEYDHILWIDCGEGSLLKSFERLARDLEVKNLGKLDLKEMATKSFDELTEFKCLWIYDNAENYKGKDGIINFLPKSKENFYCIITSRSREWGTKNVGFGKIAALELDIFSDEEALAFLKSTLDDSIEYSDSQLKELGRLIGNLPLALQLAVAALIEGKINLQNYIDQTSSEDLGNILDEEFDDYEKTINTNVKISLDLILQQENGKLAHDILMIFGYIRPDDVESAFLMKILKTDETSLFKAISLLEKYNLITKTTFRKIVDTDNVSDNDDDWSYSDDDSSEGRNEDDDDEALENYLLSIHRLLQQVIRHNGRGTEEETLRNILSCPGFIDYKLLPFTKYANSKLRKNFPKIKAELLDQDQLRKLVREERFEESVRLAKFISEELKTHTSRFNYAICLAKNEQLEESVDFLEKLENEETKEDGLYGLLDVKMGMLSLESEVSRDLIYGHLLVLCWRLKKKERMQKLLEKRKLFQVIHSSGCLDIFIRILLSDLTQSNYSLRDESFTIKLKLGTESKKIDLSDCSLDLSSFDRLSPTELALVDVSFTRNGLKLDEVTANEFIDVDNINLLTLNCMDMCIDLSGDVSLEYLFLGHVRLLGWKESKWNIQRLRLSDIPFLQMTKMTIKEMEISKSSLDISCLPRTLQKLDLDSTEVVCSGEIDLPNLNYLTLQRMDDCSLSFFHSLDITHIHFKRMEEVNVDLLPKSVTHINITKLPFRDTIVVLGGVRRVDKLILEFLPFSELEKFLSHFQTDDLVVHFTGGISPKELIELTKKEIKKIAVGWIQWGKEDFSILSSHVDRKADFYLWEGGRGKGIEWKELTKLYYRG